MLEDYIKASWMHLLRNSLDVALDPKVGGGMKTYLYIPPDEDAEAINLLIHNRRKLTESQGSIEVKVLSSDFTVTENHGILYLPHDYVVPGGRFNEMYGWDSFWIILGLLHDDHSGIAVGMVENFIYEINHYGGKVLNANRTYYLSRSHPPMLAVMALAVLSYVKDDERQSFLERAMNAAAHEYEHFWKKSRFDEKWGVFRYGNIDQGALGLCPEVAFGERDSKGLSHYDKITAYLRGLPPSDHLRQRFFDIEKNDLALEAIAGDRAMRESGFDASMHMGYYGLETMDFSPVCLNSLLYVQCHLLAEWYAQQKQTKKAAYFANEAAALKDNIQKYMWNSELNRFSNFNHHQGACSTFLYMTCAYPLWAGIATAEQAQHFCDMLPTVETSFGIRSTDQVTGCQWDGPFMWAPLVYFTVAGLKNYGFTAEARRVGQKFVDTVRRVNDAEKANFEKYNADTGTHKTEGIIEVGYSENVVGFGWTNGTVLEIQKWLDQPDAVAVVKSPASFGVYLPPHLTPSDEKSPKTSVL